VKGRAERTLLFLDFYFYDDDDDDDDDGGREKRDTHPTTHARARFLVLYRGWLIYFPRRFVFFYFYFVVYNEYLPAEHDDLREIFPS